MGAASRLSTKSEIVTLGDKAIHPNVLFWPNQQGVVAMVRTIISFGVKKETNRSHCGNLKFYSLSICRVEVNADTYDTRTCIGMTHPILNFLEFLIATNHTKDYMSGSTISLGPIFHVTKRARGMRKSSKYHIQYHTIFFREAF